jgi:hypothetical protein
MMQTKLTDSELSLIQDAHANIPSDYLAYLREIGWGESASGRMIYSGPVDPESVYGPDVVSSSIVLLGDDMQGYCLGYDLATMTYGETTPRGEWEPWPEEVGFGHFVRPD